MASLQHPSHVTLLVVVVHLLLVPPRTKATQGGALPTDDEENSGGSGWGDERTGLDGGVDVGDDGAGMDKDVTDDNVNGTNDESGIGGEGGGGDGGRRDTHTRTTISTSTVRNDKGTVGGEGETADGGEGDGDDDNTERKGDVDAGIDDAWSGSPEPTGTIRPKSGTEAYHDIQGTSTSAGVSSHQQTTLLFLVTLAILLTTIPTSPVYPYLL